MFTRSTWITQQCKLLSEYVSLVSSKRTSFKTIKRPSFDNLKIPNLTPDAPSMGVQISHRIKLSGPITVADYMKQVLTNPASGYYINKDVFGERGDFVTSPEVTQLYGEMLAIWFIYEWQKLGSPKPFQIVELGPGKGTLLADFLRVMEKAGIKSDDFVVNVVEVSPTMQRFQADKLCLNYKASENKPYYFEGDGVRGSKMFWYKDLDSVPKGFNLIIANEFLDALPIHRFKKTENGWREILIDLEDSNNDPKADPKFRYVLSKEETIASKMYSNFMNNDLDHFEICPQALKVAKDLATRVNRNGGIALLVDYGHDGSKGDTFRAFKNHKQVDPLQNVGDADLTADVNFKLIKEAAAESRVFGPISQRQFLLATQIDIRLKILLERANDEQKESLKSGYDMLMNSDKMGECFKFMALFPKINDEHYKMLPVTGFDKI